MENIALRILVFDVYESEKLAVSVDLPPNFLRSCKAHEQTAADFCTGALLCAPTDGGLRVAL